MTSTCRQGLLPRAFVALALSVASCRDAGQPAGQARDAGGAADVGPGGTGGSAGTGGAAASGGTAGGAEGGRSTGGSNASGGSGAAGGSGTGGVGGGAGAGTAAAGGGAGGRTGGGGGSGGLGGGPAGSVEVPLGSYCTEAKVTGQLVASKSPVVFAVRLMNTAPADNSNVSIVPLSATDAALVSFSRADYLATVAPAGVSVEATGVCGYTLQLTVDGTDAPTLFAATQNTAPTEYDRFYSFWTRAQPTWSSDFVVKTHVTTAGSFGSVDGYEGVGAIIDGAAHLHAIVTPAGGNQLSLYDRSAPGLWKLTTGVASQGLYPVAVVDSLGRLRIVSSNLDSGDYNHFSEWTDGMTIADFRKDTHYGAHATAAGASGMIGVARVTTSGIVVTFSDGATVSEDHLVPGTAPVPRADPCYTTLSTCMPVVCQSEGISSEVALAATSDGAYWLAYRYLHYTDEYAVDGINRRDCWKLSKSSTTNEVVLVRLSADGSSTRSNRWSYSVSSSSADGRAVSMVGRGSRLFLAIPDQEAVDVFVVDATKL